MDIVIDFDGTVVSHEFPKIGKEIGALPVLRELVAAGHNLILFTMRSDMDEKVVDGLKHDGIIDVQGNHLTEAVNWFNERDIPLYGIQTNPTQFLWTSSPKAYGQIIIDDAALGCPLLQNFKSVQFGDEVLTTQQQFIKSRQVKELVGRPFVDWLKVRQMLVVLGYVAA